MTPRQRAEMRLADAEWRARRYGYSHLGKPLLLRVFHPPLEPECRYEKRDGVVLDKLDAIELILEEAEQ